MVTSRAAACLVMPLLASCAERALPIPGIDPVDGRIDAAQAISDGGVEDDLAPSPISCAFGAGFAIGAPWPMAGRCPDHAGRAAVAGPRAPRERWTLALGSPAFASPVVDAGEIIYQGTRDGTLRAIDGESGAVRWSVRLEVPLGVPAISSSGALLVGGFTIGGASWFHALDARGGAERWRYPVFEAFGPTLDETGRVYVADAERVLALRVGNGDEQGQFLVRGSLGLDPLLVGGDTLVIATVRSVEALGLVGRGSTWSASLEGRTVSLPPAASPDGTIWLGSDEGRVLALAGGSGAPRRIVEMKARVLTTPAITAGGVAWFGVAGGRLVGLDPGGADPRAIDAGAEVLSLITDADGALYAACDDGSLRAFDPGGPGGPGGGLRWRIALGAPSHARPAMGAGGTIYLTTDDAKLHAIGP